MIRPNTGSLPWLAVCLLALPLVAADSPSKPTSAQTRSAIDGYMAGFFADERAGTDIRDCISVTSFTAGTGDPTALPGFYWNLTGSSIDVL